MNLFAWSTEFWKYIFWKLLKSSTKNFWLTGWGSFFSYFAMLLAVVTNVFFKDPGNSTSAEKRGAKVLKKEVFHLLFLKLLLKHW